MDKLIKKGDLYYPTKEIQEKAWIKDDSIYKEANKDPVKFWAKLAKELHWEKKWKKDFEHNPPYFKWFVGGKMNITQNALDRHLKDRGDRIAFVWEPEPTNETAKTYTYSELAKEVNRFSNALKKLGIKKGDRVGIYLPMIPEIIIAMLACARIGAIHAVVFSAFSPIALQTRMVNSGSKILITSDGYYRNGSVINLKKNADEGIKDTPVEKMVVVKRMGNDVSFQDGRDLWWNELVDGESEDCSPEIMDSEDPLFILYTSGSTGIPKGCIHTTGGYTVQANFTTKWIFDLHDDDIFWSTADMGWITGHTYSCYGPLLCGASFIIFEGLLIWPEADRWCEMIEKYKVSVFYTAPTAVRMFEKLGTEIVRKHNLDTLRLLGSVGEPIDESAWHWYFKEVGKERCPIVDTWWQTETGGILITSLPGVGPFKPSFTGIPFPGIQTDIFDEDGTSLGSGKEGNLILHSPFSPGLLRIVYQNPKKYLDTYWSHYGKEIYFTSDGAYKDESGLIRIIGRVDDVIKVAGHRVTTGEMESAVALSEDIIECAIIGIPDEIKGQVPVAFVVSKTKKSIEEIKKEVIGLIKKEIGPIALPKEVYLVEDLPKTRSGKIMRRILRKLFSGEELGDLSTLANPESVDKLKKIITT